jgi:purine nucleosidase
MNKPFVILDHDGGVDDYLATMLLMTFDHVQPVGIVVTPADCYAQSAVSATRKILDLMGFHQVPVAESRVRGLNPFPRDYRRDSVSIDWFPNLNERPDIRTPLAEEPGERWLAMALLAAPEPVTLLVTGPLSTVAAALDLAPEIEGKISRLLWMGGALNVPGNVVDTHHDRSAEWNVYWDPPAAHRVWQTTIPIVLCPLDITNNVPCTEAFLRQLGRQRRFPLSDLAGHCYALVAHQRYYFWDVLTTAYLGRPDLFTTREWETAVIPDGPSQGRTVVQPGGRKVLAMDTVDTEAFYAYMLAQFAR